MRAKGALLSFLILLLMVSGARALSQLDEGITDFNLGDYESAAAKLSSFLKTNPYNQSAHEYLINSYLAMKDNDRALVALENAIESFPKVARFYKLAGQLYGQKLIFEKAAAAFEKYRTYNPDDTEANELLAGIYFNLGIDEARKGDEDRAIEYFKQTVEINPDYGQAYINIAAMYIEKKDYESARDYLGTSIRLFPENYQIRKALFNVYIQTEAYDSALVMLEDIYNHEPENIDLALQLAMLYRYQGKIEEATNLYDSLLKQYPRERKIYDAIIGYWQNLNKQAKMRETYELMLQNFPDDIGIYNDIAKTYEREENWPEARATYEQIIAIDPENTQAYLAIANTHRQEKSDSAAISAVEEIFAYDKNNYDALKYIGIVYSDNGNYAQALDIYRKLYDAYPDDYYSAYNRGFAFWKLQKLDQAEKYLNEAKTAGPGEPSPWFVLGEIAANQGQIDAALSDYRRALELGIRRLASLQDKARAEMASNDGAIQLDKLNQYDNMKDEVSSVENIIKTSLNYVRDNLKGSEYKRLLESYLFDYPTSVFLHIYLADWFEKNNNIDKAVESYEKAISLQPTAIEAHLALAGIYENQNNLSEALRCYRRALAADQTNVEAADGVIRVCEKQGSLSDLCDEWLKLYRLKPDNFVLKERLIEILHKANRYDEAKVIVQGNSDKAGEQ